MLRIFLILILVLHGLIHLMGFVKGFGFMEINQLRQSISRPVAMFWLLAAILLVSSGVLLATKMQEWWILGFAGIVVSQVLVFSSWQDARFGSILNLVLLLAVALGFAHWKFRHDAEREMQLLLAANNVPERLVSVQELQKLPPVVQRWLELAQVTGKPVINTALVHQAGRMKTAPDKAWGTFRAKQVFSTHTPGFIWMAEVKASDLLRFSGKDSYQNGSGHMLIKVYSVLPVVNQRGAEIDQGTLVRYLAESIWLPTNALNPYISWKQIDQHSAEASMSYRGVTARGRFSFNEKGDPIAFVASRYYLNENGQSELRPWQVELIPGSFREFEGYRIPCLSRVSWELESGFYHWLDLEVKNVRYNLEGSREEDIFARSKLLHFSMPQNTHHQP